MKQSIKLLLGGALLLSLPMFLTSCEDILGEWDKPAPSIVTPSDGGGGTTTSNTYIKYTAPGTSTNEPIGDATKWEYTATADVPAGTYYVEGTVNCAGKITLTGDVNIILKDGSKLTIAEGITYTSGSPSLKIFAQSTDPATMGSLVVNYTTATDGDETPAVKVKGLEIHGGKIEATAYSGAADVYCRYGLEVLGDFIMYDGDVTATAEKLGQGIVSDGAVCSIEIDGGTLTAHGGDGVNVNEGGGAAIWGSGNITINGGTVNLFGGNGAMGTSTLDNGGQGIFATSGSITINGGTVNATGGNGNASAGYGLQTGGTGITINGGTITATSAGTNGVGICSAVYIDLTGTTTSVNATGAMHGIFAYGTITCDGATVFGKATDNNSHGIEGPTISYISGVIEGEGGPSGGKGFDGTVTNRSGSDKTFGYKATAGDAWTGEDVISGADATQFARYMILPKPAD